MNHLTTFEEVFVEANKHNLYHKLVLQLNKDLLLANIDLKFPESILPTSLKLKLHETLYMLMQKKFSNYLNLLYIIDISEEKIKRLEGSDALALSREVTFLILKREWKKVWFRDRH